MDSDQYRTPQKLFARRSPALKFFNTNSSKGTPKSRVSCTETTPSSFAKKKSGAFHIFPVLNTPPSRFPKVVNPFEAALADRLHLPLICSPSLFQRPSTPQHSSTQFEWTIEEVSSLGPANVEPHETQFQATPDPDLEAKAQAAISSYFKEQQIVPSPVDCPLRNQKIILPEPTGDTPIAKSGRRIRDGIAQTILTFPSKLSQEIEEMLQNFFTFNEEQQQSPTVDCDSTIDYEARDASLRRKLFETSHNSDCAADAELNRLLKYDEFSPPPKSPDMETEALIGQNSGSSFNKSSFGSLSPISKLDSPLNSIEKKLRTGHRSPLQTSPFSSTNYRLQSEFSNHSKKLAKSDDIDNSRRISPNSSLYRSTPDKSITNGETSPGNMSIDVSFNGRVSRLMVNSSKKEANNRTIAKSKSFSEVDIFNNSRNNYDDDEMQVSQLSVRSSSSSNSSQHPDTPVSRRRSASRKNLSQSFSCHLTDDDEDDEHENGLKGGAKITHLQPRKAYVVLPPISREVPESSKAAFEHSALYRTDSGFNDMTTNTADDSKFREAKVEFLDKKDCTTSTEDVSMGDHQADISMICCSTPTRTSVF